jgi:hypothetical protein
MQSRNRLSPITEGLVPLIALDDLRFMAVDDGLTLPSIDLIYLDVEGHEMHALIGAHQTIKKFRPVICFEDKGLSERYGVKAGDAERWLADECGYFVAARFNRDVLCVWGGRDA